MGDAESKGIGIINKTDEQINVVLSMAAPHYYENGIKPNQIFYRWPGAVHYTVCVWIRDSNGANDMNSFDKGLGIAKGVAIGVAGSILGLGAAVATSGFALAGGLAGGGCLSCKGNSGQQQT